MKKKVLIIGGGFGGLSAAKELGAYPDLFDVHLYDRRNYHLFQPLLYQVATAGLSPSDIAVPIRSILSSYKNVSVVLEEVTSINPETKTVSTPKGEVAYDYLISACGSRHSYFGKDEWEDFAPGLKTLEMATEIRRRILTSFESAEIETNPEEKRAAMSFVVIGGGPTGVETAGAIIEIATNTLARDFRNINPQETKVYLVEAGPKVLASFSSDLSRSGLEDLQKIGVEVLTNSMVVNVDDKKVTIKNQDKNFDIPTRTVIWAAGVKASSLNQTIGTPVDRAGRVMIKSDLTLPNHPQTFVIGDQANFLIDEKHSLPGLAPVAIQQGRHAARNIVRAALGKNMKNFVYFDKGQMATIGTKLAVMQFKGIEAHGFIAWISWLFVHIMYLIGFKNRVLVMFQWFWSYITFNRGSRLIMQKDWKK
jgi:NADH dehydrogenase